MSEALHTACLGAWQDTMRTMLDAGLEAIAIEDALLKDGVTVVLQLGGSARGVVALGLPISTVLAIVNRYEDNDMATLLPEARTALFRLMLIYAGNTKRALAHLSDSSVTIAPPWLLMNSTRIESAYNLPHHVESAFNSPLGHGTLVSAWSTMVITG